MYNKKRDVRDLETWRPNDSIISKLRTDFIWEGWGGGGGEETRICFSLLLPPQKEMLFPKKLN